MLGNAIMIAILFISVGGVIIYGSGRLPKPKPGFDLIMYRLMVPLWTFCGILALWILFNYK